jgi:hypothetical protein
MREIMTDTTILAQEGRKKKREKNGNPGKSDQLVFIAHRDLE